MGPCKDYVELNPLNVKSDTFLFYKEAIQEPTNWHKFIIENVECLDKFKLLKIFMDFVSPSDLLPLEFTPIHNGAHFIVRNCSSAIKKILENKLVISNPYSEFAIRTLDQLAPLKDMSLKEIILDGNHICGVFSMFDYTTVILNTLPTIEKLDGVDTNDKIQLNNKNFIFCDEGVKFVNSFLEQFYTVFDSFSRENIKDFYHKNAMFSLTSWFKGFQKYNKVTRNIKLMDDLNDRYVLLSYGNENIEFYFKHWGNIDHVPTTFKTDLLIFTPTCAVLVVSGVFIERRYNKCNIKCNFSRQFVFRREGEQSLITNDLLHITNNDPTVKPRRKVFVPVSAAQKKRTIKIMNRITCLDKDMCYRLLRKNNFELDIVLSKHLKSLENITDEEYNKQVEKFQPSKSVTYHAIPDADSPELQFLDLNNQKRIEKSVKIESENKAKRKKTKEIQLHSKKIKLIETRDPNKTEEFKTYSKRREEMQTHFKKTEQIKTLIRKTDEFTIPSRKRSISNSEVPKTHTQIPSKVQVIVHRPPTNQISSKVKVPETSSIRKSFIAKEELKSSTLCLSREELNEKNSTVSKFNACLKQQDITSKSLNQNDTAEKANQENNLTPVKNYIYEKFVNSKHVSSAIINIQCDGLAYGASYSNVPNTQKSTELCSTETTQISSKADKPQIKKVQTSNKTECNDPDLEASHKNYVNSTTNNNTGSPIAKNEVKSVDIVSYSKDEAKTTDSESCYKNKDKSTDVETCSKDYVKNADEVPKNNQSKTNTESSIKNSGKSTSVASSSKQKNIITELNTELSIALSKGGSTSKKEVKIISVSSPTTNIKASSKNEVQSNLVSSSKKEAVDVFLQYIIPCSTLPKEESSTKNQVKTGNLSSSKGNNDSIAENEVTNTDKSTIVLSSCLTKQIFTPCKKRRRRRRRSAPKYKVKNTLPPIPDNTILLNTVSSGKEESCSKDEAKNTAALISVSSDTLLNKESTAKNEVKKSYDKPQTSSNMADSLLSSSKREVINIGSCSTLLKEESGTKNEVKTGNSSSSKSNNESIAENEVTNTDKSTTVLSSCLTKKIFTTPIKKRRRRIRRRSAPKYKVKNTLPPFTISCGTLSKEKFNAIGEVKNTVLHSNGSSTTLPKKEVISKDFKNTIKSSSKADVDNTILLNTVSSGKEESCSKNEAKNTAALISVSSDTLPNKGSTAKNKVKKSYDKRQTSSNMEDSLLYSSKTEVLNIGSVLCISRNKMEVTEESKKPQETKNKKVETSELPELSEEVELLKNMVQEYKNKKLQEQKSSLIVPKTLHKANQNISNTCAQSNQNILISCFQSNQNEPNRQSNQNLLNKRPEPNVLNTCPQSSQNNSNKSKPSIKSTNYSNPWSNPQFNRPYYFQDQHMPLNQSSQNISNTSPQTNQNIPIKCVQSNKNKPDTSQQSNQKLPITRPQSNQNVSNTCLQSRQNVPNKSEPKNKSTNYNHPWSNHNGPNHFQNQQMSSNQNYPIFFQNMMKQQQLILGRQGYLNLQQNNMEHQNVLEQRRRGQEHHRRDIERHRSAFEQHRHNMEQHRRNMEQHQHNMEQHRNSMEQHRNTIEQQRLPSFLNNNPSFSNGNSHFVNQTEIAFFFFNFNNRR